MRNDMRYDIDKYCIKQEAYEILAHTHNMRIDDLRLAIKHLTNVNLIVLMVCIFTDNFINGTELLFSYIFLCYLA